MPGTVNSKGIYEYAEDDAASLFSDLLNLQSAALTALRPTNWTSLSLASGFVASTGIEAPGYRIVDGWCELRGVVQVTTAIAAAPDQTVMVAAGGVPASANATSSMELIAALTNGSPRPQYTAWLNPRNDGSLRVAGSASSVGYISLDGVRWRVA